MSRRAPAFGRLFALLCALCASGLPAGAAPTVDAEAPVFGRRESAELDSLVRDLCRRDIVLLGEDANHGGARTLEVKVELVRRLTARCGFGGVLFESQFYDLLDEAHAVEAGTASAQGLADGIGPLWSRAREAQPLIRFLHRERIAGRLRVGGIDPQVGGIDGHYSRERLGSTLAALLADDARRADCATELERHNAWRYDEAQPFDDAARERLRTCGEAIRAAAIARAETLDPETAAMAAAYARYLGMALDGDGDQRDLGMFELVQWHRARWPRGTKLIVWCATVHAARRLDGVAPAMRSMGAHLHARHGERMAVVGFTALGGAFGSPGGRGPAIPLPRADETALETVALGEDGPELRYVDRKRLRRLGTIAARPIDYRKIHAAPWVEYVDALVVLREERPVVRAGTPAR